MNFRPKNLPQNECSVGILSRLYFIKEYVAESLSHSKQYIFKNLQKSVWQYHVKTNGLCWYLNSSDLKKFPLSWCRAVMKTAFTGTVLLPLNLKVRLDGSLNGIGVPSMWKILMLSSVVLMWRLTEWQRFHFWYQPRDALVSIQQELFLCKMKWESYQMTKKIRIWGVLNLFRHLWKLANENLSYIMLSHDTTIVLSHAFNSHSLCNQLIDLFHDCVSVVLPWPLWLLNHSTILWLSSGYFSVKHPIVFCFADNLISRFAWSFLQRWTIASLTPYSLAILELFLTASVSTTI